MAGATAPVSEDCLTLNVTTLARPARTELRPVMVFIHGGAFVIGGSSCPMYQGESLVRRDDIVYVNFNYRLGLVGWLQLDQYSTKNRPIETNLGLRDQQAALTWIQRNIERFGGDPQRVTVFGESAGGISITTHLATPSAHGLFTGAIAQSAAPRIVAMPERSHRWAREYMEILGQNADDVKACNEALYTSSMNSLNRALNVLMIKGPEGEKSALPLCPMVDGDFLPRLPIHSIVEGDAMRVPLIIGTNDREGSLFTQLAAFSRFSEALPASPRQIDETLRLLDPDHHQRLVDQYLGYPKNRQVTDIGGDAAFWFPSVEVMGGHSRHAPTWAYRFDYAPRTLKLLGLDATHGTEMYAVMGQTQNLWGQSITMLGGKEDYLRLTATMQDHWLHFARYGEPGGDWPRYDESERLTMIYDSEDRIESDPRRERRLAWEGFPLY